MIHHTDAVGLQLWVPSEDHTRPFFWSWNQSIKNESGNEQSAYASISPAPQSPYLTAFRV